MGEDNLVRLDTRLSGQLRRYHTWPIIGQQTVAEHCWQIMRIYCSVVDTLDPHMIQHIMFHDIGETFIGDLPYPVKSENEELKKGLDFLEQKSCYQQLEHWDAFRSVLLSDADKKLFKQIEFIEMAEFGMDQMCLGNDYGYIIANRCLRKVYQDEPNIRLVQYTMKRIELFNEQYKHLLKDSLGDWWSAVAWHTLEEPYGS
jgi:5'-deoxynucleotidase YfbR-like HD superfamily hydrolase